MLRVAVLTVAQTETQMSSKSEKVRPHCGMATPGNTTEQLKSNDIVDACNTFHEFPGNSISKGYAVYLYMLDNNPVRRKLEKWRPD